MPKDQSPQETDPIRQIMADMNKERCPACGGTGRKRNLEDPYNRNQADSVCPTCGGSGSKATIKAKLVRPVATRPHKTPG
ncbi:MAG: hypothetical protein WC473_02675 [Patescibacteria group bacterium]|jgi:excinuclease UvrABC ATPase subunit